MSSITSRITVGATFELTEIELRALDALVGYGTEDFLKVFYKEMGEHYLKPHERGLRKLFETVRREVPPALSRVDRARELLKGKENRQ